MGARLLPYPYTYSYPYTYTAAYVYVYEYVYVYGECGYDQLMASRSLDPPSLHSHPSSVRFSRELIMRAPLPKEVRRLGVQSLRIVWDDGHASQYDNPYLRNHCPCAECRERPERRLPLARGQGEQLYAKQIGVVGRYALSIEWSDGHDSGIYSYRTLRDLCPCEACCPAREGREKAS